MSRFTKIIRAIEGHEEQVLCVDSHPMVKGIAFISYEICKASECEDCLAYVDNFAKHYEEVLSVKA